MSIPCISPIVALQSRLSLTPSGAIWFYYSLPHTPFRLASRRLTASPLRTHRTSSRSSSEATISRRSWANELTLDGIAAAKLLSKVEQVDRRKDKNNRRQSESEDVTDIVARYSLPRPSCRHHDAWLTVVARHDASPTRPTRWGKKSDDQANRYGRTNSSIKRPRQFTFPPSPSDFHRDSAFHQ